MNVGDGIEAAIKRVIEHFQQSPRAYFAEEDVRWRVMKEIEASLAAVGASDVTLRGGTKTSAVHGEYPTPFRCSMKEPLFSLLPSGSSGQRGHFDVVVLNAAAAAAWDFNEIRSQDFRVLLKKLHYLDAPLVHSVIEIKLLRDLAYPKRTRSIELAAQDAKKAVDKVAAALNPQPEYYPSAPFAGRGFVLLFDNSRLARDADVEPVREEFKKWLRKGVKNR